MKLNLSNNHVLLVLQWVRFQVENKISNFRNTHQAGTGNQQNKTRVLKRSPQSQLFHHLHEKSSQNATPNR